MSEPLSPRRAINSAAGASNAIHENCANDSIGRNNISNILTFTQNWRIKHHISDSIYNIVLRIQKMALTERQRAIGAAAGVLLTAFAAAGPALAQDARTVSQIASLQLADQARFVLKATADRNLEIGRQHGDHALVCLRNIFSGVKTIDGKVHLPQGTIWSLKTLEIAANNNELSKRNAEQFLHGFVDRVAKDKCGVTTTTEQAKIPGERQPG